MAMRLLAALALALLPAGLSAQPAPPVPAGGLPDGVTQVSAEDAAMNAAIAQAQATLPQFLKLLQDPPPGTRGYVIKFPLGGYEHIWVGRLRLEGDKLIGVLANDPVQEDHYRGELVEVPLTQVSDWSYVDAKGVVQGNFTTRVLLDMMPQAEADKIRRAYGWDR